MGHPTRVPSIDNSDLDLVLNFVNFKDKNGTVQVLEDEDNKLISTVCKGICATGNTAQSVIDATCKELESGPEWVDKDEKILTEETVDTTWKEECQRCEDIKDKDPGSRFNWTCTLKVKDSDSTSSSRDVGELYLMSEL